MNRIAALLGIIFLVSSLSLFGQKFSHPNIVFILADDLGYGDLGCYGQKKIETPNIDRLSVMGVKFTQFYSGSTVCAPSRASFMTGLHTGHTPVRGNVPFKPEGQMPLPESAVTFPMLLRNAGYRTAAFGKWGLGFITTTGDPARKGFDEFYGYNCQSLAHNYFPDHLWHNHDRINLPGNLKYDSAYSADMIHTQALQFLDQQDDKPFFLYLPYTLPHADVVVPHDAVYDHYVKKFAERPIPTPTGKDEENSHYDPYPHAAFAAMVSRLDRFVGEIMDKLKQKDLDKNTLLIFTSDNGPHKEKGGDPAFFNSNGGLRGIKRDLYEGGVRVPFIAYYKGITKAGTINATPAAFWDLYPTFLEMAGVRSTKNIDGISILSLIKGKQPAKFHDYFYWELHESGGKQGVRFGDWKGVRLNVSLNRNAAIELYNLKTDPKEEKNIAAEHPDIVKRIDAIMKEAYVPNKDWPLLEGEVKK